MNNPLKNYKHIVDLAKPRSNTTYLKLLRKLRSNAKIHSFGWALGLAIGLTILLTSISLEIYKVTGSYLLDFSRPGLEKVRQSVDREQTPTFAEIGTITPETIDEFKALYDKKHDELDKLGRYDSTSLDDTQLQLGIGSSQPNAEVAQ